MKAVSFPSLEAEVSFLRGLTAVHRMADDILEDCFERGLDLDTALDVFLTQCARMVHAVAGFVLVRGTRGPVLTRVLGTQGADVFEVAKETGPLRQPEGRMLFCTQLTLGKLNLGAMGLVVEGRFEDGGQLVMGLVEAIGEQLDSAMLGFLALMDGESVLERLDSLAVDDDATPVPQGRIGRYEVVTPLGTGGMAQVLVARARGPEGLGRLVALKRILPHLSADPSIVGQFLDEARIGLRLAHPNLVTVYDIGEAQGAYYIAMELVRGIDLDRLLRAVEAPLPPAVAVAVVVQGLRGLYAAHTLRGEDGVPLSLVHRDLSPHNLMVGFDGRVKVLDFGVAKARSQRTVTLPGIVKGKPLYMSPEQARGARLDARSDLFAMGLILYQALTGERAFDRGEELASMYAICDEALARPEIIPLPLWEVMAVALAKRPEKRFRSAQEMADRLASVVAPMHEEALSRLVSGRFPDRVRELDRLDRPSAGQTRPARTRALATVKTPR
ncbi:serine/threonine-protein kinase [Stigmatella aurantiaca]|uniref:Serine/threonine protein kinase n=1 Tax=Stigmatella aurantiaca (strain DW4/3-1) TaxID=378806 RepID=Q09BG0_STIAD|nr:serine/threonine-protein kinase [Stigmatella aurantiaca]ADO69034.1 serine/threonine protein kinase [Stigmatella aurantiaca DW4/3-1]EAU69069.1 serine/Threonine protein kinase [Stigmatella aurantiaca DW4/3-1]